MTTPLDLAENWVRNVWQRGDMNFAAELCADDYTDFTLPDSAEGDCAKFQEAVLTLRAVFPDLQVRIADSYEDEDYVILRTSFQGTQREEYLGFEPTPKTIEWESIDILHFQEGKLSERWAQSDLLTRVEEMQGESSDTSVTAERADLIGRLADVPAQVRAAIHARGVLAARNGEWSTQATLGHLWRVERQVWQARLEQMARQENPHWEWWEPDRFDWEQDFGTSDVNVLLDAYEFLRGETCRYLNALSDTDWARRGTHVEYGELDVVGLMEKALEHDQEHVANLSGTEL